MMYLTSVAALILFIGFFAPNALAQQISEEVAKKYNISFPIPELGGCESYTDCRNYCQDPLHRNDCTTFAKQKKFYKEEHTDSVSLLKSAEAEFGCNTEESCRKVCERSENWVKCGEFAKRNKLTGGLVVNPENEKVLQKAQERLGCDSLASCFKACTLEENRQRCSDLANEVGLRGGVSNEGPGGCSSEENCEKYCSERPQECGLVASTSEPNLGLRDRGKACEARPGCFWQSDTCYCSTKSYEGPKASAAYENADENARFCREFPEKCASVNLTPAPSVVPSQAPTPKPSVSSTPTPKPTIAPTPSPSNGGCNIPDNITIKGADCTWCYDQLGYNASGNDRMRAKYSCKDKDGTYESYCSGNTVKAPYCTGIWNGSSWSNVRCETSGGYVCTGSAAGDICSDGACVPGSSNVTPSPAAAIQPSATPAVQGVSTPKGLFETFFNVFFR